MVDNFAFLHAYIATVGSGNASSAPSARLPAPSAVVDKGQPIPSAAAITHGLQVMRDSKRGSRN